VKTSRLENAVYANDHGSRTAGFVLKFCPDSGTFADMND